MDVDPRSSPLQRSSAAAVRARAVVRVVARVVVRVSPVRCHVCELVLALRSFGGFGIAQAAGRSVGCRSP